MKILVVEDDKNLVNSLEKGLTEEGFVVQVATDGFEARDIALSEEWDLFIFDMMLPGLTGIQLCELIRFKKINTPILMLSALSETEDKIKALDIGADDYLTKPFHFQELISRVKALNRISLQYALVGNQILTCGDLSLNFARNKVERAGELIELSNKEFKLLQTLLEEKDKVVSRSMILQKVWNTSQDTYTNVIDVYISYLRSKIDANHPEKLIHTVKGRGYMIAEP